MSRHALRAFFRRAALIVPLAAGGCDSNCIQPIETVTVAVRIDGGLPDAIGPDGCAKLCQSAYVMPESCAPLGPIGEDQRVSCTGRPYCIGGRRPDGLAAAAETPVPNELGRFFAALAHLEEASVYAFRALADELRRHHAPAALVAQALRAADDEVRHARVTARLAHRFGAVPPRARVAPAKERPLFALAAENAVEGCVRETYGALAAGFQARAAADRGVRRALAAIARDEERHAELAWSIDTWTRRRLTAGERLRLDEARHDAVAELAAELDAELAPCLRAVAGLPSRCEARALLAHAATVWS